MSGNEEQFRRRLIVGAAAAVLIVGGLIGVFLLNRGAGQRPMASGVASEALVRVFYKSLAALDVEDNEFAARELREAVKLAPGEPAVWANLAVAALRLQDLAQANDALQHAISLAPDSRELDVLRAEVLQQTGKLEPAIEQWQQIHDRWPENIAATFSLVQLLGQLRREDADAQQLSLLTDILDRAPENIRARCEQARLAATLSRREMLRQSLDLLLRDRASWPTSAQQQLEQADQAERAGEFRQAAVSLAFFENLIKPLPQYQQSLTALGVTAEGTLGTPMRTMQNFKLPVDSPAKADLQMAFESQPGPRPTPISRWLAFEQPANSAPLLITLEDDSVRIGNAAPLPFPGSTVDSLNSSVAVGDLNADFRQDLVMVGATGCQIYFSESDGSFAEYKSENEAVAFQEPWRSVWLADIDADGDLDLLLSDARSPLEWIRNNGDGTFLSMGALISATEVVDLKVVDLDLDGTIDLVLLYPSGNAAVWLNQRGGTFESLDLPQGESRAAITAADLDWDGDFELISLLRSGRLLAANLNSDGKWIESTLATGEALGDQNANASDRILLAADLDNNGAVDLVASQNDRVCIWLGGNDATWTPLANPPVMTVSAIADVDGDGLLDLVGTESSMGRIARNASRAGYRWQVIQPTANTSAGDKRINSFGLGGRIELRAVNFVQSRMITSPQVHFGLGNFPQADVARIVWPNGTTQAEFQMGAERVVEANQRLKGSCPWVFAFDGQQFQFIKDFIWRSPLGLRINAQATAGVVQTEDWIKIPGSQLATVDGGHQLRITAELWETHFFDWVSLMAVDHPESTEVFLDERFVPNANPEYRVFVTTPPQSFVNLIDQKEHPLDSVLAANDGVYSGPAELGRFQGVAAEHWVAFSLPPAMDPARPICIVGHGWVYPTDSSLNVAIGQGNSPPPLGLVLEQQLDDGSWQVVRENLGFPAGKNKDVVIEIPPAALAESNRFRLRTNLEIYWDSLRWSYLLEKSEPQITRLATRRAELRYRGYSVLRPLHRRRPDTPIYRVASTGQMWSDLEGYYTRYGDVSELVAATDDRYVIMNAGDELVFEFTAATEPATGWRRDFVLVGDGWVKDGDFNTVHSRWVRPLPAHDLADYDGPVEPLEQDPVYRRHPDDWRQFHTRYVTPRRFQQGIQTGPRSGNSGEPRR